MVSTADFDSASWGSSPCGPANLSRVLAVRKTGAGVIGIAVVQRVTVRGRIGCCSFYFMKKPENLSQILLVILAVIADIFLIVNVIHHW